jgi:hypothetical protein
MLAEAVEAGDEEDGDGDLDAALGQGGGGGGRAPDRAGGRGGARERELEGPEGLAQPHRLALPPRYEDLGRVVVRIRVEVLADGKPGQVRVMKPGPVEFNRRAIDCARDETYLPALDPDGRAIPGDCEFSIEFLN